MKPDFVVPARYFYALGAAIPPQITARERYEMASVQDERQVLRDLSHAVERGLVSANGMTPAQAARRLRSLGAVGATLPCVTVKAANTPVHKLVKAWLSHPGDDVSAFWKTASQSYEAAHLDLVLRAVTDNHEDLVAAVEAIPGLDSVEQLAGRTAEEWKEFLHDAEGKPRAALLPSFTEPGTDEERVGVFIRHLRKFFDVDSTVDPPPPAKMDAPPGLGSPPGNALQRVVESYQALAGSALVFGTDWDEPHFQAALDAVFPADECARASVEQMLRTIDALLRWTDNVGPAELRFSLMEALYARGFTGEESVLGMSADEFRDCVTGTVAYEYAAALYEEAGGTEPPAESADEGFQPINPDGSLTNCIPPPHLSPLGPVAYLHEMLGVSADLSCDDPLSEEAEWTLGTALAERRGPLGDLLASRANLETPLPLIDLVNECLEAMAGSGQPHGVVYDTAAEELGGHQLADAGAQGEGDEIPFRHDPVTLFAALPEHSSPATPVASFQAYTALKSDFSAPVLPYSQPLDVSRTYLRHLGTSRYAVMRRFRREITEFVLDPENEPQGFQRHLWRYPVRIDVAREYLGVTPEEYDLLFTQKIADLPAVYGFESATTDGGPWTDVVVEVPEFLERTGLTYCELYELWKAEFVKFRLAGDDPELPECELCCLATLSLQFEDPQDPAAALERLAVFIRLWHKLQQVEGALYTFWQLRDVCDVLHLFRQDGTVDPDFIRQLAAFQLLRDRFGLELADEADWQAGTTGADRTHLLALWVGETAGKWTWATDHLLDRLQPYAQERHGCGCRPPEFIKLLAENLDPLSRLAGFDPGSVTADWHARPTHTLRFAEVLAKIYASDFGIGEILFLFTADDHVDGDDPFPLSPDNEALDSPFDLPDDEAEHSLWALREKLLAVEVTDEEASSWTWPRIEAALREDFGFVPPGLPDPLLSLGEHFFPNVLESCGCQVDLHKRQYRVELKNTSPAMWNTPPDGPWRYDSTDEKLWTQLPMTDEAVLAKLSRIRPLKEAEPDAVRDLYFLPRLELARFAFLFTNFGEAEERLVQEADESKRWAYFQRELARCIQRSGLIAEHLAGHVAEVTGTAGGAGADLAWKLLRHLYADENKAQTSWESDSGTAPAVTWEPLPSGGAFAALLGLKGTGLLGEIETWDGDPAWRELRGPMDAFGARRNAWNAPVPTLLPSMDFTLSDDQERFVGIRNGFALANLDGKALGGAEGFRVRWRGALLVEQEGTYAFRAGAPTAGGEEPDFEAAEDRRWRVLLRRGQKSWVLLAHQWPDEDAPPACSAPLSLRRGVYELSVELEQPPGAFDRPERVSAQTTGFQLKYSGPDTCDHVAAIPFERLFLDLKDQPLDVDLGHPTPGAMPVGGAAQQFLGIFYSSTLRDIRRTYQRAFKALLFAHRFGLSAQPIADDGQSEIGYMLSHAAHFAGTSFYKNSGFTAHRADFDFNFLPLADNYHPPDPSADRRAAPSVKRRQALFDGWERTFDYTRLRAAARTAPERPVWLLFHEAAEAHPDDPAHLLRHMGADLSHVELVLTYFDGCSVSSTDLEDERWAIRAWQAETWIRSLLARFFSADVRDARPDLWAADDPEASQGNDNLAKFFRVGCIENGRPRRYDELRRINDGLRQRARRALVAYLCGMQRVALPWGGYATEPKHLSELLLVDVETGLCEKASRIEEAVSAVQTFVQRARLGLEPDWTVSPPFVLLWERRFATFRVWQACQRRWTYRENWIDWDELEQARHTEAFRFLESELRRSTLTVPVPGGLEVWDGERPPAHPGIALLQTRDPSVLQLLQPPPEGLGLLGTPERHACPSWLAPVRGGVPAQEFPDPEIPDTPKAAPDLPPDSSGTLPFWIEAAIRLGVRFVRVAAAGIPPGSATFDAACRASGTGCCIECGPPRPPVVDEYYFWLLDSRYFDAFDQDSYYDRRTQTSAPWHDEEELPGLLHWESQPMVHLAWCRVHDGELRQPRRSYEGVRVDPDRTSPAQLVFRGRAGDSLRFEVDGGEEPTGYPEDPEPGFRYDLATDSAVVLPLVVEPPSTATYPGGLAAYPYFAFFRPGACLMPPSLFSPAQTVAGALRAHCRFEAALKWYELVFNPLQQDSTWARCPQDDPDVPVGPAGTPSPVDEDGVCCPNAAVSEVAVRDRSITLHYLETLLQWGGAAMRRHTPEAFQQARLVFDTAAKILGAAPRSIAAPDSGAAPPTVEHFVALAAPLNPRLLSLYERVDDRLALIHACLNAPRLRNGQPGKDMPYWGDNPLRDGWQTTARICADEGDWCSPHSCYRFLFLVQKAQELAGEVRGLGAALLAAFEKGDAEYLASLRATHERQMLHLALEVRQNQWREADWQVQALYKTREAAQTRRRYFATLIQNGLISGEVAYQTQTAVSLASRAAANVSEGIAEAMGAVPDMWIGIAGIAGTPLEFNQMPLGSKLGGVFATAARIANGLAGIADTTASLSLTEAGWVRREDEWRHQVEVLDIEIEQIELQILAAERRRDVALRELDNHQRQIEQSGEVHDFLRDKFTHHALYLWLQKETAALHFQMYELAYHTARQSERAFNYERGHTARSFVPAEAWDDLHEGLQAGERLQLSLRRMEKAYLDENCREYELTKHISLRLHFPLEFLLLKVAGECEIEIPEWLFDLDYPGHYLRRIKNVTLTLPCVVGPYTGVHCRLTLLSSTTRVDPRLTTPPASCCGEPEPGNGYEALADDPRLVKQYAATEAIATSSGRNDSGMFELSFRDERYLPFEFAGAVSRFRIELPAENNYFDLDTLSDVVVHLNYTAREGGEVLRSAAHECAQPNLPGAGWRFFDIRSELPEARPIFLDRGEAPKPFRLELGRDMFPYLPGQRDLSIHRLVLLFEAPAAIPSAHHVVQFVRNDGKGYSQGEWDECEAQNITCVASAEWPGLYHGVLDVALGPLGGNAPHDLGTLIFPGGTGRISRAFLFCRYDATRFN